ncbi:unnamed protein product [Spirodela intermedia]|uniref:Uncharacterized protein n=1 Tax=Spirodela intermedia TaxID=51605 RepID=A0A7I8JE85_SPIIN|nr:unnamed protein product [Spirodela intermedia]CAA6667712.1 unnamed protein product [Spirodela intermedia]
MLYFCSQSHVGLNPHPRYPDTESHQNLV